MVLGVLPTRSNLTGLLSSRSMALVNLDELGGLGWSYVVRDLCYYI